MNIKAADALKAFLTINGASEEEFEATGGIVIDEKNEFDYFLDVNWRRTGSSRSRRVLQIARCRDSNICERSKDYTATSGVAPSVQTFSFSVGFERGESLESLKQRYNEFEQQTHQLENKLKQSISPSEQNAKN